MTTLLFTRCAEVCLQCPHRSGRGPCTIRRYGSRSAMNNSLTQNVLTLSFLSVVDLYRTERRDESKLVTIAGRLFHMPLRYTGWILIILLCGGVSGVTAAPPQYGDTVEGLRMNVSLDTSDPNKGDGLQVTIQNTGEKDVLLSLGWIVGYRAYVEEIFLELTTSDGKHPGVILTGVPPGVAGRVDPLVIPLLAGASYDIRISAAHYYIPESSETLPSFITRRAGSLRMKFQGKAATSYVSSLQGPSMISFWLGTLFSNEIRP